MPDLLAVATLITRVAALRQVEIRLAFKVRARDVIHIQVVLQIKQLAHPPLQMSLQLRLLRAGCVVGELGAGGEWGKCCVLSGAKTWIGGRRAGGHDREPTGELLSVSGCPDSADGGGAGQALNRRRDCRALLLGRRRGGTRCFTLPCNA